jgi:hypothetical protein
MNELLQWELESPLMLLGRLRMLSVTLLYWSNFVPLLCVQLRGRKEVEKAQIVTVVRVMTP